MRRPWSKSITRASRIGSPHSRPGRARRRTWLVWFDGRHPIVAVVDQNDKVVGYAATFSYADRCCYAGIAEFSVYVARSHRGKGVGAIAMTALVDAATKAGFWKLLSRVFVENQASLNLLRSVGFRQVGVHERMGSSTGCGATWWRWSGCWKLTSTDFPEINPIEGPTWVVSGRWRPAWTSTFRDVVGMGSAT